MKGVYKELTMKKLLLLSGIALIFTLMFSGCGNYIFDDDEDDYRYSGWEETEGYVEATTTKNERTGKDTTTYRFVSGTHPDDKTIAVLYKHKYDKRRTPNCNFIVKTVQTDLDHDIVNEYVKDDDKSDYFTITSNQYTKKTGFIFYCDDEYIYVINNLFSLNYLEHDDSNQKNKAECRFEIIISRISKNLRIDMDYNKSQNNKPY